MSAPSRILRSERNSGVNSKSAAQTGQSAPALKSRVKRSRGNSRSGLNGSGLAGFSLYIAFSKAVLPELVSAYEASHALNRNPVAVLDVSEILHLKPL